MDFRAALEYFRDRSDYDRGFISNPFAGDDAAEAGLQRTAGLLGATGKPDRAYPIIHVAGTKGKGSTCAFIESIAGSSGLTTGTFTTPHLHSIRERIRINGEAIGEAAWADALRRCADGVATVERRQPGLGRITAFELNTVMALLAFRDAAVDVGVVEVGLGGRLDATNVVEPAVSMITPVSFDHQAILGETLEQIAGEKAGIIKQGTPVVVAAQQEAAAAVIASRARAQGAPLYREPQDWSASYKSGKAIIAGPWGRIENVELGLTGWHQAGNAGAALMALSLLDSDVLNDTEAVIAGLESVWWPGRYEQIHESPAVIVDGAHNEASMGVLVKALLDDFTGREFVVVFGSYADKDLAGMLSELKPLEPVLIATRSRSPRARDPSGVVDVSKSMEFDAVEQPLVDRAIDAVLETAGPDAVIVATGSLSVVSEVREHLGLAVTSSIEREILGD